MASCPNCFNSVVMKSISLIRMAIGALLLAIGVAQVAAVNHWISDIAVALFLGFWTFLTGFFGYMSVVSGNAVDNRRKSTKCYIKAFMAFSLVSIALTTVGLFLYTTALIFLGSCASCSYSTSRGQSHCRFYSQGISGVGECRAALTLAGFAMLSMVVEGVLSFVSAISCCSALCCQPKENAPQVVFIPAEGGMVQMQGGSVIGQYVQVPQTDLAQQLQATTAPQPGHQAPQPAYSGPMASGVAPTERAEKQPEKRLQVSVEK